MAIASVIKEGLKASYVVMRQQSVQLLALFNMTTKMAILLLKSDSFQTKIDDSRMSTERSRMSKIRQLKIPEEIRQQLIESSD